MKKIFLFSLIISVSLFAKEVLVEYDVTFGLFGEVGDAVGVYKNDGEQYSIEINATSRGFASFVSNNRYESHRSYGDVKDGFLVPKKYFQEITTNSSWNLNTFIFDYRHKKVYKKYEKKTWNLNKEILEDKYDYKELPYFADNDLLTLFFNLNYMLPEVREKGQGVLYAAGANKKNGAVDLYIPTGEKLKETKELLKTTSDNIIIAVLNKKIFGSEKGELAILLDSELYAQKAVLKDVILFGDVRGVMTHKEEKK